MKLFKALMIFVIFMFGLAAGNYLSVVQANEWEDGDYDGSILVNAASILPQPVEAQENPADRVPEKSIAVYKDRVVLDLQNAQWATFTDTHSMEPVLFQGANAIEVVPASADEIKVGDIVSYRSDYAESSIIHRVVYKGEDEDGTYFIMKGDNLPTSDPGRVRFNQIQRVVVAIVY
jgi:hypothetical protein